MGIGKVLIPFVFVFSPSLLIVVEGFSLDAFLLAFTGAVLGITALSAAFSGYLIGPLRLIERPILVVAAMLMVAPEFTTTLIGVAVLASVVILKLVQSRGSRVGAGPA